MVLAGLAGYLVDLDTSVTALSTETRLLIVQLYNKLYECDKAATKYTMKSKKEVLPGPWRASRKRTGAAPGVQASERFVSNSSSTVYTLKVPIIEQNKC